MPAMTTIEDKLAALLVEAGFSFRQTANFLNRDGKSIKNACARVSADDGGFTAAQLAKAEHVVGYMRWMEEGAERGYLEQLVAYVERLDVHKGKSGYQARLSQVS